MKIQIARHPGVSTSGISRSPEEAEKEKGAK